MRVKCDSCSAGYTLPASKLKPGRRVQFSCRRCGNRVVVAVPGASGAIEPRPVLREQDSAHSHAALREAALAGQSQGRADSEREAALAGLDAGTRQGTGAPADAIDGGTLAYRDAAGRRARQPTARRDSPGVDTQVRWFVANDDGGYRKLFSHEVRAEIEAGAIDGESLLWRKGWPEWRIVAAAPEWQPLLAQKPQAEPTTADRTSVDSPAAAEALEHPEPDGQVEQGALTGDEASQGALSGQPHEAHGDLAQDGQAMWPADQAAAPGEAAPQHDPGGEGDEATAAPADEEELHADALTPEDDLGDDAGPERTAMMSALSEEAEHPSREEGTNPQALAPGPDPDAPSGQVVVSGLGRRPTGQQAISLPIVRAAPKEERRPPSKLKHLRSRRETSASGPSGPGAPARRSPSGRFAPGRGAHGTPMDVQRGAGGEGEDSSWSPATDTYIGPRDRFTRRLGSEEQRIELLAQVEREQHQARQIRMWQWIALGCASAAIVAFAMTVYAMINLRITQNDMRALQARVETAPSPQKTSPLPR